MSASALIMTPLPSPAATINSRLSLFLSIQMSTGQNTRIHIEVTFITYISDYKVYSVHDTLQIISTCLSQMTDSNKESLHIDIHL